MTPMVITDHMVNRPSTDTEATSQGGGSMIRRLRNVCATDHSDLLSRQFRWACRCAFQGSPSPLFMHVFVVVGLRSKKQMNRIDACCDIACVKDIHAIRNRSEREMPRETMSQPFSVIETHFSVAATIFGGVQSQHESVFIMRDQKVASVFGDFPNESAPRAV